MKRRWFLVLGVYLIAANLWLLNTLNSPIFEEPMAVVTNVAFLFAGLLFVLGGISENLGNLGWYRFVGLANLIMGVGFAATYLLPIANRTSTYEDAGMFLAICAVVGGASLAFIGFDWVRGGRYFDLSTYEEDPILGTASETRK
ncbi:hypothetical protein [Halococcus sp. AFM35]|uniref:hypothetical protein n=1 Tax=Halococcus sp. AFM35 TaxID=3421653 RepID=UPI003EB954C7